MSTDYTNETVLKSAFMKELHDAFKHIDAVNVAFEKNDFLFFFGCDVALLTNGAISFEEYYCRNILKKVENVAIHGVDPTENARADFVSFLDKQEDVNTMVEHVISTCHGTNLDKVLTRAKEILSSIFIDFHPLCIKPRLTSGATIDLTRLEGSNPLNRIRSSSGFGAVRTRLGAYFRKYGFEDFCLTDFVPFHGNDLTFHVIAAFVAKTWKIDRTIGLSPVAPLAFQTGLGDYMDNSLKRVGIDISTAQCTHIQLARENSLDDGHLMTLDQSNASNNILVCLCKRLLDTMLFEYMDAITPRSISVDDGKTLQTMHMMANQGNGYIFPLQTAIFYALTKSVCELYGIRGRVSCYGDDLIAPKACYQKLSKVFGLLGLQINADKTFYSGKFRESCGGDFFLGSNVRPHYVAVVPSTTLLQRVIKCYGSTKREVAKNATTTVDWIRCINGIRRVGYDNNLGYWRSNAFRRFWLGCISHIQPSNRLFAPIHYGDGAIGTSDERLYALHYKTHYITSDGVRCAYPNKGLHSSGHPYSGWYINIYVNGSSGTGKSFEQSSKGLKSYLLTRLVMLPHLRGCGIKEKITRTKGAVDKSFIYPSLLEIDDYSIRKQSSVFFLRPSAPKDDIDAVFALLGEDNPITDSSAVAHRGQVRYENALLSFRDSLLSLLTRKREVIDKVSHTDFDLV